MVLRLSICLERLLVLSTSVRLVCRLPNNEDNYVIMMGMGCMSHPH
nr:MAG TPA: hypothetical protein [Herelleviridae sp.]